MGGTSSIPSSYDCAGPEPPNTQNVGRLTIAGVGYKNMLAMGADERGLYIGPNCLGIGGTAKLVPWQDVTQVPDKRVFPCINVLKVLSIAGSTEVAMPEHVFSGLQIASWVGTPAGPITRGLLELSEDVKEDDEEEDDEQDDDAEEWTEEDGLFAQTLPFGWFTATTENDEEER